MTVATQPRAPQGPPRAHVGETWLVDPRGKVPWAENYSEHIEQEALITWASAEVVECLAAKSSKGAKVRFTLPVCRLIRPLGAPPPAAEPAAVDAAAPAVTAKPKTKRRPATKRKGKRS